MTVDPVRIFLVGIQKIQIANDGALAIEILKRVGDTGEQEGGVKIDMIIVMLRVDGFELMQWIRHGAE